MLAFRTQQCKTYSYRPFSAMNCDGKLGRLLFFLKLLAGHMELNGREEGEFHGLFFGQYLFLVLCVCVFGIFMGDKMHTRAHSPIHIQL